MSYVLPQVKVFQEFSQAPSALANPLRALIVGPQFDLQRYEDGDGYLGQYSSAGDVAYSWPNRPAGGIVDQAFTSVTIKDALLRYYHNAYGASPVAEPVANYYNYVRVPFASTGFKANGDSYPLDSTLNGRPVQIGDVVHAYYNSDSTWSRVVDILPTMAAAQIGSVSNIQDIGTTASYSVSATLTGTGVAVYDDTATEGSTSKYDGISVGAGPTETYTVTVLTSSDGAGAGATARITSASGTDDVSLMTLTLGGCLIGTRGLKVYWTGTTGTEFIAGDVWSISVAQAYTKPTTATGGTFTGTADTTYIITCTKQGTSTNAQIMVTSTNGADISGPHTVTTAVPIAIGTKGVTFTLSVFTQGLYKGCQWKIPCTAAVAQNYTTLVLADNLAANLYSGSDFNLDIFYRKTIDLPADNYTAAPSLNWSQSATQITLKAGAAVYDGLYDSNNLPVALSLGTDSTGLWSQAYVTYRSLNQTYVNSVGTIDDISSVASTLGPVNEDNPLALGVYYALLNSGGTDVKFIAVSSNDLDGYSAALEKCKGRTDLYTVVPMSKVGAIQNLCVGHVGDMSNEIKGQWRITCLNSDSSAVVPLIDVGSVYPVGGTDVYDADRLLATVADDPLSAGTQYTLMTWSPSVYINGAGFVDMGVRAGDTVRINYTGDGFGGLTWSEYLVDAVLSNQQIRLLSGPTGAVSVASKFSIYRTLSRDEEAAVYGAKSGAFGSRRVYHVWPDQIEDTSGTLIPGYYACAAIAGLISGVVPQQGLTHVTLQGFGAASRSTQYFTDAQLNTMAGSGTWIITQDHDTGEIFNRHEVSTCTTDLNCKELMLVKNVDSMSYIFQDQLKPYIGRANVTPRFLAQLERQLTSTIDYLKASSATPTLGGQLIDAEISELRQHAVNLDTVVCTVNITPPYPANVIELHLVV